MPRGHFDIEHYMVGRIVVFCRFCSSYWLLQCTLSLLLHCKGTFRVSIRVSVRWCKIGIFATY